MRLLMGGARLHCDRRARGSLPQGAVRLVALLSILSAARCFAEELQGGTVSILTQTGTKDFSSFPNGSYFPEFHLEQVARWPRDSFPRGEGWSRGILARRAAREMSRGAKIIIFASRACFRCQEIIELLSEVGVQSATISYESPEPAELVQSLKEISGKNAGTWLFLGTRYLGDTFEVELMYLTGELHWRLEKYGVRPRTEPPVNRAPVIRVQPRATPVEATKLSIMSDSSWVHPAVLGRLDVEVVEAKGLVALTRIYDPIQRKVVRGVAPAAASPFGPAASNPFAVLAIEDLVAESEVIRETLEPKWNQSFSLFPVRNARSILEVQIKHQDEKTIGDPFISGDPPLDIGRVRVVMPLDEHPLERWYPLESKTPGQFARGELKLRVQYHAVNHMSVQAGSKSLVGGIVIDDADVVNGTVTVTLSCSHGSLSLPVNRRIAYLRGDPLALEDPRDSGSKHPHRYKGFGQPPARIGFRQGDGARDREIVFVGLLADSQAALSELVYHAPSSVYEDKIHLEIDDMGHTGIGGNKTGRTEISVTVFPGPQNQAPRLHMWPEMLGQATIPVSGARVERVVPDGVEAALHGLYLEDQDSYNGFLEISITSQLGLISLHGLGPWERADDSALSFEENLFASRTLEVRGRQITTYFKRGSTTRNVLCSLPGGFTDEIQVEGPYQGQFRVQRNNPAGHVFEGAISPVRSLILHAGQVVLHHIDAQSDFELQYKVKADSPVNVLVMNERNYLLYLKKQHFVYEQGSTFLDVTEPEIQHYIVQNPTPQRWFVIIEQSRDVQKPYWRRDGPGDFTSASGPPPRQRKSGEYSTGMTKIDIALDYDIKLQRLFYDESHFKSITGFNLLEEPTATVVCAWVFADQEYVPPPGLNLMGLQFSLGDGHRDMAITFRAPLDAAQTALATMSYLRHSNGTADMADNVHVTVNDLGHTGSGGAQSTSFTIAVTTTVASQGSGSGSGNTTADPARVIEVLEDSRWIDIALQPFQPGDKISPTGHFDYGDVDDIVSAAVPVGNYTAPELAAAISAALLAETGEYFIDCHPVEAQFKKAGNEKLCAEWAVNPPIQLIDASGGSIDITADEEAMNFVFTYTGFKIRNGRFLNAWPCKQGGGPAKAPGICGWWGGRFILLFGTGPNRDRSLAALLGFEPVRDYPSSPVQHLKQPFTDEFYSFATEDVDEEPDNANVHPAVVVSPFRYFGDLHTSFPTGLKPTYGKNRAPTITVPFKARADFVSVSVPPDSMRGNCHVRNSGISYTGPELEGGLSVQIGVGNLLNRYYELVVGDVTLRDYGFYEPFVPDETRAQATYEWDHAVNVVSIMVVQTRHGIVQIEGFVGGHSNPFVGQYDAQATNDGWVSVGLATGMYNNAEALGPFVEGFQSIFLFPNNTLSGSKFRFIVRKTWHQKKWAIYRAYPTFRQLTHDVDGVAVVPRLAKAVAGVEQPLRGVLIDDLDLGQDKVQAYFQDVRRLTVEISCMHGELFVDAGYGEEESAAPTGRAANTQLSDQLASSVMGDLQLGVDAIDDLKSETVKWKVQPYARPEIPGVETLNLAQWRGVGGDFVHFTVGAGVADRRMVFTGRLSAIQQAMQGLRYVSRYSADPGRSTVGGERVCTEDLMCGQSSSTLSSYLGGHGGVGYDAIKILVRDHGHSDRVCKDGGSDPLGECIFEPGLEQIARAVIEMTIIPKETNQFGYRATAFNDKEPCLPCYSLHPADHDLCVHKELYWGAPDVPGHSYRRTALTQYSAAQRQVWEQEFAKPCDNFLKTKWSDSAGGQVRLNDGSAGTISNSREVPGRAFHADSMSHGHGDPSQGDAIDDDLRRFMDSQAKGRLRPWEG